MKQADQINFGKEENDGDFETEKNKEISEIPCIMDYEWTDWVLSHLYKDEFFNGLPTVDGLRRIIPIVLGQLVEDHTDIVQVPTSDNNYRAAAVCTVSIKTGDGYLTFSGAADAFQGNLDKKYNQYLIANAETRAEGRALRKALRLRKTLVAEEITEETPLSTEEFQFITETQINFINKICERLDINVQKFINSGTNQYDSIKEISHDYGLQMSKILNTYQQNKQDIPDDIRGYKSDWREND